MSSRLNGKPGKRAKALVTLTDEERRSLALAQRLIGDTEAQLSLLRRGLGDLWRSIAAKYDLPKSFNYDQDTGAIVEA